MHMIRSIWKYEVLSLCLLIRDIGSFHWEAYRISKIKNQEAEKTPTLKCRIVSYWYSYLYNRCRDILRPGLIEIECNMMNIRSWSYMLIVKCWKLILYWLLIHWKWLRRSNSESVLNKTSIATLWCSCLWSS